MQFNLDNPNTTKQQLLNIYLVCLLYSAGDGQFCDMVTAELGLSKKQEQTKTCKQLL